MEERSLRESDSGVNLVLEYVLTFTFASVLFMVMLIMTNGLFIQGPQTTASKIGYVDVGNDVTAKIVDTYLVAPVKPESGNVSTSFDVPATIASNGYMVDVLDSDNHEDKLVVVHSINNYIVMNVTLNGVSKTIPVSGSTWSQFPVHRIWYDSNATST